MDQYDGMGISRTFQRDTIHCIGEKISNHMLVLRVGFGGSLYPLSYPLSISISLDGMPLTNLSGLHMRRVTVVSTSSPAHFVLFLSSLKWLDCCSGLLLNVVWPNRQTENILFTFVIFRGPYTDPFFAQVLRKFRRGCIVNQSWGIRYHSMQSTQIVLFPIYFHMCYYHAVSFLPTNKEVFTVSLSP